MSYANKSRNISSLDNMSLFRYWLTQNDLCSRPKWRKELYLGLQ